MDAEGANRSLQQDFLHIHACVLRDAISWIDTALEDLSQEVIDRHQMLSDHRSTLRLIESCLLK